MKRGVLIAVVMALSWCGSARAAVVTVDPWTTEPYAGWLAAADTVPLPTLVGVRNSATFCGGRAPEVFACTDLEGAIYMRHRLTLRSRRVRFMHEVGHNVDWQLLGDDDRQTFAGLSGYGTEFQPEVFAELYARCATGGPPPSGWRTTRSSLVGVCDWLKSLR